MCSNPSPFSKLITEWRTRSKTENRWLWSVVPFPRYVELPPYLYVVRSIEVQKFNLLETEIWQLFWCGIALHFSSNLLKTTQQSDKILKESREFAFGQSPNQRPQDQISEFRRKRSKENSKRTTRSLPLFRLDKRSD